MNSVQSGGHTSSLNKKKDSQFEELALSSSEKRNWRGICIALLVISAVLGVIVFSIFLLSPEVEDTRIYGRRILLSDIYNESLKWKDFNGSWINDKEFIFQDNENGISIFNAETLEVKLLMDNSSFRRLNVDCYSISPDLNFILLYQCSTDNNINGTKYYTYEIFSSNIYPLSPIDNNDEVELQKILWSPSYDTSLNSRDRDIINSNNNNNNNIKVLPNRNKVKSIEKNKIAQAIAFIYNYDIYYKPKIHSDLVCRITTTGNPNRVINGIPDWLYKNTPELNGETLAFSTNGTYLSFFSFNITNVQKYDFTWNGKNLQYPIIRSIRYPRYNTPNPNVTIYIVNLAILKMISLIELILPKHLYGEFYVGNMLWISNNELTLTYTARDQTFSSTVLCSAPKFICTEIQREVNNEIGVDIIPHKPIYLDANSIARKLISANPNNVNVTTNPANSINNKFLIKIYPILDGKYGYFRQIALIPMSNRKPIGITIGRSEVTEILGWDEKNQAIYYMAAPERRPGQRHLYKIVLEFEVLESFSNDINIRTANGVGPVCLTCDNSVETFDLNNTFNFNHYNTADSTDANGRIDPISLLDILSKSAMASKSGLIPNNCLYNKIHLSVDYSYYIQECLGPDTPSIYLVDSMMAKKIFIIDRGDELKEYAAEFAMPEIRTFSVEIKNGFHAQVRMFLPPGMKEDEEVSLPLVLHIDASPDSQLVSEKFQVDWNWYLACQKNFIVAQIDGRGTGFQGDAFRSKVKGNISVVDVEDQSTVLTYLRDNFRFIDPTKICAYGWGYGGYVASILLSEDSKRLFQCIAAISPIVSFNYYYSFFTEKYFGYNRYIGHTIQEADLSMRAQKFFSKNYLLIHGTSDTLVHQQHTMLLTKALIQHGVIFRHQVYTDEDHDLSGVLYHVHKTLEAFLDDNFGYLDSKDSWDDPVFFIFKE